ncbi:polyprenyl diphosphate synthase [Kribbella sp. VKM Ac-2566]|uniref:polyprenyl diphosphate synthase n=1 Tax=Kribbella sp. VKM Ac-2566 TaxID=2512218 RepID=UPI0010636052|nr:polyprenyl diphosphate synthase [Kribbella sp. VKM Ac-2566]TDW86397.1 undecaprenyl pyrophosphate synthetase [Kribbella sp. VKM Ac-2566]
MLYSLYTRRLRRQLAGLPKPEHVAIVMDGNRRWARGAGYDDVRIGHRFGAKHLEQFLQWSSDAGVTCVTAWVASADNLRKRDSAEVDYLMELTESVLADHVRRDHRWRLHVKGQLDLLPDSTARALKEAVELSRDRDAGDLTLAIGYSGRLEVVDAVRSVLDDAAAEGTSLEEVADRLTEEEIGRHLYVPGLPDPDLVIRTSGELRMSDFLLWQATRSDIEFCDLYWPAFREVDLLRALRTYGRRRLERSS